MFFFRYNGKCRAYLLLIDVKSLFLYSNEHDVLTLGNPYATKSCDLNRSNRKPSIYFNPIDLLPNLMSLYAKYIQNILGLNLEACCLESIHRSVAYLNQLASPLCFYSRMQHS